MSETERRPRRREESEQPAERSPRRRTARRPGTTAAAAAAEAAAQVRELTGRTPEGITSLERTEDGWRIGVEVVESRRIPDSTDILAVYSVVLDERGDLVSYRRESRYPRGRMPREDES